ncbi:1-deoxy-D-xylulose-5-phosphate synthase [Flavobacterium oreochromis]|uniref:1-deoxy-D-xylulose-5-phosphate synthase n=1 Tax=Flavobacterium oreochromis TaxID=2906078 RepID=A0ABW8P8V1_9FLAO|nr:1-deoxy-D-xylulose-5-phosphate synthase [Flavobacterium oreochromis]OWP78486.1 1-deoxy-D-xylulose-5-phosphate synthase [Flavobacterium oreochromis]
MKSKMLESIYSPSDLKKIKISQLPLLAKELRDFIITIISQKEGHLGASLGVVELTIALHYVFNTPEDLLVWDVGHQAYGHKILTGRKDLFHTNRDLNGISGFPKRSESEYDAFGVGHSSTSISAILGMAMASKIKGDIDRQHIAVIGDASIVSGMAFEALNHAGDTDANILVVLNDNAIGIDPSVGALKEYLTSIKEGKLHTENNIFRALNFDYSGPIDGHDIELLISEFERLKKIKGPKILHVITTKGKGLQLAEQNQVKYHAPGKFDPETGKIYPKEEEGLPPKFQDVFGKTLVALAKNNDRIIGVTPAMPSGSSMKFMMEAFPKRAFDVGIAEQHAVTFSAGMATQGMIVFCNVYSTFLQRAYDQVIHDVALQKLPLIFCLDRAGFVGEDGATHHGLYDIAYLSCIPDLIVAAPLNEIELRNMMYTFQLTLDKPVTIRYPRGRGFIENWELPFEKIAIGKALQLRKGRKVAVLSTGTIGNNVMKAFDKLETAFFSYYHFPFVKPLDEVVLHEIAQNYTQIITVEEGCLNGGFGSLVSSFFLENNYLIPIKKIGVPDEFIEQGTVLELHKISRIDSESLCELFKLYM